MQLERVQMRTTSMLLLAAVAVLATVADVSPGSARGRAHSHEDGVRVRAPYTRVYTRRGVRVRAPFTSVRVASDYWGGGVRVRAPFTNVDIRW